MVKFNDWREKYKNFIHDNNNRSFYYGEHDCCITAGDMVKTITGKDLAEEFRGYKGPKEAVELMKKYGGVESLVEHCTEKHNLEEIPALTASRGDLVLVDSGNGRLALGWVDLDPSIIMVAGVVGFVEIPITKALRSWRVN